MKGVTTQVISRPRTATPVAPRNKAVIIDTERTILSSRKAYTYAPSDFTDDNDTVMLYDKMYADLTDLSVLTVNAKVMAKDTPVNITKNGSVVNLGLVVDDSVVRMYEWALGKPTKAGPIVVAADGVITDGTLVTTKTYYMVAKVGGSWVMDKMVKKVGVNNDWIVDDDIIPAATYASGDCMVYEDLYGLTTSTPQAVSVFLTINEESTNTDYRGRLTEISGVDDIYDMYGKDATLVRGNIAYSAYEFLSKMKTKKTFYIAPMTSEDDIMDLIMELSSYSDTYLLIYNIGTYSSNKSDVDALIAHVDLLSSPLYKRERRVYTKEAMVGTTDEAVELEMNVALNSALGIDNPRVSLILECGTTDSLINYCARRYSVSRDYCLTNEYIEIGDIWNIISNLTDTQKNDLKDNGVVVFDQESPGSIPKVMFQTTTYIEDDNVDLKEENVMIVMDEFCQVARQVLAPRIAKGDNNKVTRDPNSKTSIAYIGLLTSDLLTIKPQFSGSLSEMSVMGVEIDENDPRHTRARITAVTYKNVNRLDVLIYTD